ncbi:MAG: hypothetical protein Q7J44_14815 [Pseudotabrizicola sp.]|uniref:hypothetical protein n=1 Tax=Pseudotabrizicola sp. TaxID=2939647 RepID=UPI00272663C9|nr:hypothetical protein [Pseudotabrizicola sp.]MDO9639808.1 hypothetical protein [Pseudotabrizicola sp.]
MFFTNFGRVVAWFATVAGIFGVVAGHEFDINQAESVFANMLNIDASQWNGKQGKVFRQQGYIMLFCGLVLGILTEISRSVAGRREE